jgi:hypothetical protein
MLFYGVHFVPRPMPRATECGGLSHRMWADKG